MTDIVTMSQMISLLDTLTARLTEFMSHVRSPLLDLCSASFYTSGSWLVDVFWLATPGASRPSFYLVVGHGDMPYPRFTPLNGLVIVFTVHRTCTAEPAGDTIPTLR